MTEFFGGRVADSVSVGETGWLVEWVAYWFWWTPWVGGTVWPVEWEAGWFTELGNWVGGCLGALMSRCVAWDRAYGCMSVWVGRCVSWRAPVGRLMTGSVRGRSRMKLGSRLRTGWVGRWVWVWLGWEVDLTTELPTAYYCRNTRIFTGCLKWPISVPNPRRNANYFRGKTAKHEVCRVNVGS